MLAVPRALVGIVVVLISAVAILAEIRLLVEEHLQAMVEHLHRLQS